MGCCVSATRKPDPNRILTRKPEPNWTRPRIPTPAISTVAPPDEETVVKEVLSETPAPKPLVPTPTRVREEERPVADVSDFPDTSKGPDDECSGEVRRVARMSPARMRSGDFSGERRESEAPAGNPSRFPERIGSVPGREKNPMRRDSGEMSWRQLKFPAAGSGLGGSPSTRKTGKYPGRVRSEGPTRRIEERPKVELERSKWISPTVGNESLENPLVSLECFIFL